MVTQYIEFVNKIQRIECYILLFCHFSSTLTIFTSLSFLRSSGKFPRSHILKYTIKNKIHKRTRTLYRGYAERHSLMG